MGDPILYYIGADEELASLLSERMEANGIPIETFSQLGKVINELDTDPPRVVIVDENFAGRDSLTIVKVIDRVADREELSVFWHPLKATRSNIIRAAEAGVDNVLVRPMKIPSLVERINESIDSTVTLDTSEEYESQLENSLTTSDIQNKLDRIDSLDAVPFVVEKVLHLTSNRESNIQKLTEIISTDPHVTAIILKRANSAYYGSRKEISSIQEAITRIGFQEVRATVLSLSVIKMFPDENENVGFDRVEFWKSCLINAVLARNMAREIPEVDADTAFVGAALHDLGRIIFDEYFYEEFRHCLTVAERERVNLFRAEQMVFDMDHQEVGGYILRKWSFPDQLVDLIKCHETFEDIQKIEDETTKQLAKVIWFSSWVTRTLPYGSSGDSILPYHDFSDFENFPFEKVTSKKFLNRGYEEVIDLLLVLGKSLDHSSELPEATITSRDMYLYEETDQPVTPLKMLLRHADFQFTEISSARTLRGASSDAVIVCEFSSFHSLKSAFKDLTLPENPLLIVLPREEVPEDDRVKERAGMPVENTLYIKKPLHLDEFWNGLKSVIFENKTE